MKQKKTYLPQPEIEAPDKKLLRAPTFEEKYGWINKILLLILIVMVVNLGVYFLLQWGKVPQTQNPRIIPAPTTIHVTSNPTIPSQLTQTVSLSPGPSPEQTLCTQDAMQCPDGSYVGRSGPRCEFVCPRR